MIKKLFAFLPFLVGHYMFSQITLTHNIGNTLVQTNMTSCEEDESWARVFNLSDFGKMSSDQFIIRSAEVGISKSYNGAYIGVAVFKIDSDFPNSKPVPLGYGNSMLLPKIDKPQVVQISITNPVVVPAGVDRILVVVGKSVDFYNPNSAEVLIAGTQQDNDISWYQGCRKYYTFTPTTNLDVPVPEANFYINVTGELFNVSHMGTTTTLTHNVCDDIRRNSIYSCSWGGINWGRTFSLNDFGISTDEEFIIQSGQIALGEVSSVDVNIQFNIYKIDSNFPTSFSESDLIGSSQSVRIHGVSKASPEIFTIYFDTPVAVPANTERILVEVSQLSSFASSAVAFTAGTSQYSDDSWFRSSNGGCPPQTYTRTVDLGYPDDNFYINVTGNVNNVTKNFQMSISNICSEFLKEFWIEDKANVSSVLWDFGDPASGVDNSSADLSPFHDFSVDGTYTITATVTGKDGKVEVLQETIDVKEPPTAYGINNLYACEDVFNSGISSSFDTSSIEQQVLGEQQDKSVTYIDGRGNEYNTLPNPFTNSIKGRETIIVRVSQKDNHCCYSETSFDLIVNPLPNIENVEDLIVCESETSGFTLFNLQEVKENILANNTNISVEFFHEKGTQIQLPLTAVENVIANEEVITLKATNTDTNCSNETTFKLKVNPLPVANSLAEILGCDDNNDGISEYFDTSNIASQVLGSQTGMEVSYFDENGNQLPNPLPNPYTNKVSNQETIIVRVTNPLTWCFAETPQVLKTVLQPHINKPSNIYACDQGNGYATFDTTSIEAQIIGNQNGLRVDYFDSHGNQLTGFLSNSYKNKEPWSQTIYVIVVNELNNLCQSETSFDLIVNKLPTVTINDSYFLCNLEPSLNLNVDSNLDSYLWQFQDGKIVSNTFEATLVKAGNYSLTIGKNENGIYCENTKNFELVRSELPSIVNVDYKELSDNNFIQIIASGDGDFEYSIDGINYQDSNLFNNILGGIYRVSVRDKLGCGEDHKNVTIIDYPKYFTPNGDGINDTWQIKGITDYPNAIIFIYDRYGKLLKQIASNSTGWDGTYEGEKMLSSDYWFTVRLDNENEFKGHFSLKR